MSLFKRFVLDSNIYDVETEQTIKSLLGKEVEIIEIRKNNIITTNTKVIVDVWFKKLYLSPIKTYYINVKDLKRYNDFKNMYVIEIEKIPVLVRYNSTDKTNERIPLTIVPIYNSEYKYFAHVQKDVLHGYSTIERNALNIPSVNCILDTGETQKNVKELYDVNETILNYKQEILKNKHNDILNVVNDIKIIDNFKHTLNSKASVGYIMSAEDLPDEDINGHIIIIPRRKSDLIFYYPNVANLITAEELKFIKRFIMYDKNNL